MLGSWIGLIVLFGYTWALIHHMLGGIRHFIWDFGVGLDKPARDNIAWADDRRLGRADRDRVGRRAGAEMSMQTPLRRVLHFGAAHDGTEHFWRQRLTGAAATILVIFFIGILVATVGQPHDHVDRACCACRWSARRWRCSSWCPPCT